MMPSFEYGVLESSQEGDRLARLIEQCFLSPAGSSEIYFDRIGRGNFRFLRQAGQLLGGLALLPLGQWYGGRCVPMVGVAAVGIAPEHRGSGSALSLMQQALREMYAEGVPISVLYPATQRLYRRVGYEQGGVHCGWEIPTQKIQVRQRSLPIQSVELDGSKVFQDLYSRQARVSNGNLDRRDLIWQGIVHSKETTLYAYQFGTDNPEGYVILSQRQADGHSILQLEDWVVLTPAAEETLWTFAADHRSQLSHMRWRSTLVDPLTLNLPEQVAKLRFCDRWLLRVVNVAKALEQRGYPGQVEAELHFEVEDDGLPENNGRFILTVADGQATVTPGGKGALKLGIRGLAPLYTGLFTPHQLQRAGKLEGSEATLSTATQLFSGSTPWMPDFF